jgi:hypothetical protein
MTFGERMDYFEHATALETENPEFAGRFTLCDSLENVLDWLGERDLPGEPIGLIAQDEFSYDILIPLNEQGRWLVFGVN